MSVSQGFMYHNDLTLMYDLSIGSTGFPGFSEACITPARVRNPETAAFLNPIDSAETFHAVVSFFGI
jgi:hypothetical protein